MSKRILVVEDDPIGRKVVVDFLSAHGYRVSAAKNGPEGVEKAAILRPDLIVCDILLPKKSGFEVCFEVKRAAETRDVPVLLMSAVCSDRHAERHGTQGVHADGYFVKPFSLSLMLERIRELLPA